jgi:CspA family cold shock protein
MPRGVLKFYSERRGYGFICCEEPGSAAINGSGGDVFVHYSQMHGLGAPREGQLVTFDLRNGARGPEAVNVQLAV